MHLSQMMGRLDLDEAIVDELAELMLDNRPLNEACARVGEPASPEQVFALCRAIAREVIGERLEAVAPQMAVDRIDLAETHYADWARERAERAASA